MRENDRLVIKINYFDERELLVRREIETKSPNSKSPKCYPYFFAFEFYSI